MKCSTISGHISNVTRNVRTFHASVLLVEDPETSYIFFRARVKSEHKRRVSPYLWSRNIDVKYFISRLLSSFAASFSLWCPLMPVCILSPLSIPAMSYAVFTFNSIPFIKKYDFVSFCDDLVGVTF